MSEFEGGAVQFLPTVSTILFGRDVIRDSLKPEVDRLDAHEVLLLTPYSLRFSKITDVIKGVLKGLTVNQVSVSAEHVPLDTLADVLSQLSERKPDVVIALGGGSTIDLAKGIRIFGSLGIQQPNQIIEFINSPSGLDKSPCPQISIPTTLSGSEYTRSFSVTDFEDKKKLSLTETLCSSQTILYDPMATQETPRGLWLSSGIMALNHAIEVLVTSPSNMISDSLKLTSAAYLFQYLPVSAGNSDLPAVNSAREFCQLASWMADHSPIRVRMRTNQPTIPYSHALAYQISAQYRVPYGLIACTTLTSCLRNYAEEGGKPRDRIDQISDALPNYASTISDALGPGESMNLIIRIENLIRLLGLPIHLRDVGIPQNGLDGLAMEFAAQNSNGSEETARTLREKASRILQDAW